MTPVTAAQAEELLWLYDAHLDAMSRCPPDRRLDLKDYRVMAFLGGPGAGHCHVWQSLAEAGLATMEGVGDPPYAYFISISEEGKRVLRELVLTRRRGLSDAK
ncbi:MAG: hypothetical protein KGL39_03520 [Patescibacteria group bacterium]|nr:hypothetical protein [Patescibacteria group bacterium]